MAPIAAKALDIDHLARQALGDGDLERELLDLFELQCRALVPLILAPGPSAPRAEASHTLRGGALAVGAHRLAEVTDTLESTFLEDRCEGEVAALLAGLAEAARDLQGEIASWMARHGRREGSGPGSARVPDRGSPTL